MNVNHDQSSNKKIRLIDGKDEEYDIMLDRLSNKLNIVRHPDDSVLLDSIILLLKKQQGPLNARTNENLLSRDNKGSGDSQFVPTFRLQKSTFNIEDIPLPNYLTNTKAASAAVVNNQKPSLCDKELVILENASKCLKLLYLHDQKQLQIQVNDIISSIQTLTADPKTESKQMAIGR